MKIDNKNKKHYIYFGVKTNIGNSMPDQLIDNPTIIKKDVDMVDAIKALTYYMDIVITGFGKEHELANKYRQIKTLL